MNGGSALSQPSRQRGIVWTGLAAATLLAWAMTGVFAWSMAIMDRATMPPLHAQAWSARDFASAYLMWASMMAAMMLPSATPMVDAFATIAHRRRQRGAFCAPTALFVLGYMLGWSAFSVAATVVQWAFHKAAWLTPMMTSASPLFAGLLLLLAGVYQWSPWKHACLSRCRSPAAFVLTEWRDGYAGAAIMGLRHGMYCVGCCWALMGLLFAVSIMDLRWVAALAVAVAIEKIAPRGATIGRATGVILALTGLVMIAANLD